VPLLPPPVALLAAAATHCPSCDTVPEPQLVTACAACVAGLEVLPPHPPLPQPPKPMAAAIHITDHIEIFMLPPDDWR
jgi:hypothetical protein